MKCILTLIACSALAPFSRANDMRPLALAYPTGSFALTGSTSQLCIGQFTEDVIPDGMLLCNGRAYLMYAPERFTTYIDTSGPGGFASMTKVSLSSTHDGLIVSNSSGLSLLSWDYTNRVMATSSVSGDANWDNATQLQTMTIGSTTTICGISSNGQSILYGTWNGTSVSNATAAVSVSVGTTIVALAAVRWTNGLAFAYDTGAGLKIYDLTTLAQVYHYDNPCSSPPPMLLRMPETSTDNVIWVTQNPYGSGQVMTVAKPNGQKPPREDGTIESPVYFGTSNVVGRMALADIDGDAKQDLVLALSNDTHAQVLYRQTSGSMSFGYASPSNPSHWPSNYTLDLTYVYGSCTGVAPVIGVGDIDGDGDDDLIFANGPGCGSIPYEYFGQVVNEDVYDPSFTDFQDHIKPWTARVCFDPWSGGNNANLNVIFYNWSNIAPIANSDPSLSATHVHVSVWSQHVDGAFIIPQRLYDYYFAMSQVPPNTPNWLVPAMSIPPDVTGAPPYLIVALNYVVKNGSGVVTHSYPTLYGQIDLSAASACGGTDFGPITNGGINRPPPPPSPSAPNP